MRGRNYLYMNSHDPLPATPPHGQKRGTGYNSSVDLWPSEANCSHGQLAKRCAKWEQKEKSIREAETQAIMNERLQ